MLSRAVGVGLAEKVRGGEPLGYQGKSSLGRANSRCKGPGVGVDLVSLRNGRPREEPSLETKQGPDQTLGFSPDEMRNRGGFEQRRDLTQLKFQMNPLVSHEA